MRAPEPADVTPPVSPAPPADRAAAVWKVALLLAALSTLLKVAVLLLPSRHVSPAWVQREEQHRGNIAREILDGPLLALQDYQFVPNAGGTIVVGVLAVPFIGILGDSLASLRAVPILFNALAVWMLVLVLDRFVSRRAAWIGGVLFALAPPGYSLLTITAFASHVENNALTLLALYLFLELHRVRSSAGKGEARWALALGLVAGFALYFGYFFAVALATMGIYTFLHDHLFWLRRWFWIAVAGFAVGFTPWLLYNLATGFRGLSVYDQPLTQRVSASGLFDDGWNRLLLFLGDQWPSSFFFRGLPKVVEWPTNWLAAVALLALIGLAAWQQRRNIGAAARALLPRTRIARDLGAPFLFLLYVPMYLLAFTSSELVGPIADRIAHESRYVAPLYPFACMLAACALDHLAGSVRYGAAIARTVTAGLAALFVAGTIAVCDPSRAGETLRTTGSSPEHLARWMAWTWRTDLKRLDRIVTGLETRRDAETADRMIFTIAQGLKWGMSTCDMGTDKGRADYEKNAAVLAWLHERVSEKYKPYCEMRAEGEPIYTYHERELFWSRYRQR